jgi:hypothetical protein
VTKRSRNFWIESIVLLLIIAAGVTAFAVSAMSPLGKPQLKIQAGDLTAYAASGRLLAIQYVTGNTTLTFLRNQAELIHSNASSAESSLKKAKVESGLESQHQQLTDLATQLSAAMQELANASDPNGSISKLDGLARKLNDMEEELKH